eukprot:c9352_g1_i1 orf=34-1830(+)
MAAARLELLASQTLPWKERCSPHALSSRTSRFTRSVVRAPLCLVALPSSALSSSTSEEGDSQQLKEAAPSNKNERLSSILESGIWSDLSTNTFCIPALETIERDIDKLEHVLVQSEEETCRSDLYSDVDWKTQSKFDTLKVELCRMQTLLDSKENSLNISLDAATELKTLFQEAEVQVISLNLYKEANEARQAEELLRLEKSAWGSLEILDKHLLANEAMSNTQEMVQKVWESIANSHCSSVSLKLIEILQKEASLSFQALLVAIKDLEQEKLAGNKLLSTFQRSAEEIKEKDLHINRLQQELASASHKTDMVSKGLVRAEAEVLSFRQKLINTEGLLEKERKALRAASDGLDELDRALGNEESKVDDLFKEVSSLKAQLEQKEKILLSLTDEVKKSRGLSETARKHLDAFHRSEKKVEQLIAQCKALENQIRSKDLLLEEIKEDAFDSTEALKLASKVKQDLNYSRQREIELTQELEREKVQLKDLSRELMENRRAVKAELALRQAEKNAMELTRELALLKKGIQSRDEVIKLMEEKIEGNIHILKCASDDREAMRKMEAHIKSLESKLRELNLFDEGAKSPSLKEVSVGTKSFQEQ